MKLNKQLFLTAGAIIGMGGAIATAVYATPKAKALADKYKDDKVEAAKRVVPLYIPTLLLATAAAGCVVAKDYISNKELLALTASTGATTSYLIANRDKLKKLAENPRVKKLKESLLPTKEEFKHQTIEETGNGDLLCIEAYSGRIFRSSIEAVEEAQRKLNEAYLDVENNCEYGYACMNDYYEFLNIEKTQFGFEYGWANNEDWFYKNEPIEFDNTLIEADAPGNDFGEPIFVSEIEEDWFPIQCWQEI